MIYILHLFPLVELCKL